MAPGACPVGGGFSGDDRGSYTENTEGTEITEFTEITEIPRGEIVLEATGSWLKAGFMTPSARHLTETPQKPLCPL